MFIHIFNNFINSNEISYIRLDTGKSIENLPINGGSIHIYLKGGDCKSAEYDSEKDYYSNVSHIVDTLNVKIYTSQQNKEIKK